MNFSANPMRIFYKDCIFDRREIEIRQQTLLAGNMVVSHAATYGRRSWPSSQSQKFSPSPKLPFHYKVRFQDATRMFAAITHLAAKLRCTTDLEVQLLLTEDISPAIQTFLTDPTKPPKAPLPSWSFKGTTDKSTHIFGYLSSAKRDSIPTIRLGSLDGAWNLLGETAIKEDAKLRKRASDLFTTHESLQLITEALKLGTKFSSKTSIHLVKRYLEGHSSFAKNTRTRLESPALTAVHEAVLKGAQLSNSGHGTGAMPPCPL